MIAQKSEIDVRITDMEIKQISKEIVWIKGKKENILIDPNREMLLKDKTNARIVLLTKKDESIVVLGDEKKVVVCGPGEYEIGGVEIVGINLGNSEYGYLVTVDGVIVGVIGVLTETISEKRVARIESMDVMVYKTGGALVPKLAVDLAKKWGANYLLPIATKVADQQITEVLDLVDREMEPGVEMVKIEKDNLPDGLEVVILECQTQ